MNFKQNNPNMGKECANETRYNNIGQRHHCNNNIEKLLTYNITGQNRKKKLIQMGGPGSAVYLDPGDLGSIPAVLIED